MSHYPCWRSIGRSSESRSLLISSAYFPPQVGGISRMMAALVRYLGRERVCCLTGVPSPRGAEGESPGGRIYRRPRAFARSKPTQVLGWGCAALQILLRERPRVVQISTVYDGYLGLWLRRYARLPYLLYAHGNEILEVLGRPDSRQAEALRGADRVLAVSTYTADLVREAGVREDAVELIRLGCDTDRFRPIGPGEAWRHRLLGGTGRDGVVLLTVGNLVARKGHDMVLRALPNLLRLRSDLTYLVVGDGPYRGELKNLADRLGVRAHVRFAGRVDDRELPAIYGLADVFVLASRENRAACDVEGFGLVFLEAAACGLPVVAGRSGGIPDAIDHKVTGLLVDPTDEEEIAAAIGRLLAEPGLAERMGRVGRERVLRDFQWSGTAERVQGIVEAMVAARTESPRPAVRQISRR